MLDLNEEPAQLVIISADSTESGSSLVKPPFEMDLEASGHMDDSAKRQYTLQQNHHHHLQNSQLDWLSIDDFEVEEEVRPDFPCPYCYEDYDIASLCSHLEDEHHFESKVTSVGRSTGCQIIDEEVLISSRETHLNEQLNSYSSLIML